MKLGIILAQVRGGIQSGTQTCLYTNFSGMLLSEHGMEKGDTGHDNGCKWLIVQLMATYANEWWNSDKIEPWVQYSAHYHATKSLPARN